MDAWYIHNNDPQGCKKLVNITLSILTHIYEIIEGNLSTILSMGNLETINERK